MSALSLLVKETGWLWPTLPLKTSSFGWLRFMYPISLVRDFFISAGGLVLFADPKWPVLVGDWDAILDPKIDMADWGASGSDRY